MGRKRTAAELSSTCLEHSCHRLLIISAFLRRSRQHHTKYSPEEKPPVQTLTDPPPLETYTLACAAEPQRNRLMLR